MALYDQTAPDNSGTAAPIKVQFTNYSGVNFSSSGIVLTITGLSPSPPPGAPPSGAFTFMSKTKCGPDVPVQPENDKLPEQHVHAFVHGEQGPTCPHSHI